MVEFNPFTPEFRADPFPHYKRLREEAPVFRFEMLDVTVLTRHRDVDFVLHDPRFSSDPRTTTAFVMPEGGEFAPTMLSADPPDHTRLRTLVNKAFTARRVESLRPRIREITDQLLDRAASSGSMDVIGELAYPLPITVIAELLGVPPEDQDKFRAWSYPLAAGLDPIRSPELQQQIEEAGNAMGEYFSDVAAQRRNEPKGDMISALVQAEDKGDVLTESELVGMFILLLVAGHETTVNLIGNGLYALLCHPAEREQLRGHPELIKTAVEELLRFDGPVQLTGRHPLEDVQLDGHTLEKGKTVMTLLGAANRDPEVFADPDALVLDRQPNPHLTFGQGIHFCVGSPLARVEGQIAIGAVLERFPKIEMDETPRYRDTIVLRGLESLRVRL